MNIINIKQLTKSYGANIILNNLDFSLNSNDKVAIIGRNGAGKSTLLKIIYGLENYDSGSLFVAPNLKIGYFSQDILLSSEKTVIEEMKQVFKKQNQLKQELLKLANELTNADEEIINRYSQLLFHFEEIGGYTYEYKIETILNKFGFQKYYHQKINNLSGGERTRLALAKLLLSEPELLLLDEPSNHLDIETVEFLESFLKNYQHAVIIVSHDRYFINKVVHKIYEIEFNTGYEYIGNYEQYIINKQILYEKRKKEYLAQQKMIQKEQEFINKNIARASTTKRAQARRKKLAKLNILENPRINDKKIKLNFNFQRNTGNIVLEVKDLAIGYDKPFLNKINFLLKKGEKVAILGPNGIGKSTLLKTINQTIPQIEGTIKYGAGLKIAYFDQDLSIVKSHKTVLNEIWDENPLMLEREIRTLLGSFLFTEDDVFKNVKDLSGGEKVRLALAKLTLKKANFLILDEVTNHLDILSREVLESALINFPGTILFVSHDRFFINTVATRIIEITEKQLIEYIGDYNYYLLQKEKQKEAATSTKTKDNKNDYEIQKREKNELRRKEKLITELEAEIDTLEQEISKLNEKLLKEEVYLDYQKTANIQKELDNLQKQVEEKLIKWTKIHAELDTK